MGRKRIVSVITPAQQQREMVNLVRAFYVFGTVLVCFAVLGFLFIVYYYHALNFNNKIVYDNNSDSTVGNFTMRNKYDNDYNNNNINNIINDSSNNNNNIPNNKNLVGVKAVRVAPLVWVKSVSASSIIRQDGGLSGYISGTHTAVWLFDTTQFNMSFSSQTEPEKEHVIITKRNVVVVVDANTEGMMTSSSYYLDVMNGDVHVTCLLGVGESIYIFSATGGVRRKFAVGKLVNVDNGRLAYATINNNILLPGPIIMAMVRDTYVFFYYSRGTEVVLAKVSLSLLEGDGLLSNNGTLSAISHQFWTSNNNSFNSSYNNASPLTLNSGTKNNMYAIEWNSFLSLYVILSTQKNGVELWYSNSPYGPFFTPHTLQLGPEGRDDDVVIITHTYFHKELWRDGGRVMTFTYCTSGGSLPHLVEIEYCNNCNITQEVGNMYKLL